MVFKPDEHESESEFDLFEKTEHEPEEYDPEADLYDPNTDSLTIPQVSTSEEDAPPAIQQAFWMIVLVLNAAILALSLGVMLIGFEGRFQDGGVLIAGGLALSGLAYRRYRAFERKKANGDLPTASSADEADSKEGEDADEADEE